MTNRLMIFTLPMLFLIGCVIRSNEFWRREKEKIQECRNEWIYKDLEIKSNIKVLIFHHKVSRDIYSFPNFIIGVLDSKDTIAIMDKDFEGEIKESQIVEIEPVLWTNIEKEMKKPMFRVAPSEKENNLYCKVKIVYYGRVSPTGRSVR